MNRLQNKVAVITGGSGSIGQTTAKLFLTEGAQVVVVDFDEEAMSELAKELNSPQVRFCVADVSKVEDVLRYIELAVREFGKIDIFFNNAGIEGTVAPIVDYPDAIFDQVLAVNIRGMWLGNKYMLPHMQAGGSIIMTSSVAGMVGFAGLGAYVVSKHAAVGLMRTTAIEAAPQGIRVNSIHPSPVNNRMMRSIEEGVAAGHAEVSQKKFESLIPLGRYAEPLEIAQLVLFLGSDESQFITGTTQVIDGGLLVQ